MQLKIAKNVRNAKADGQPVVALETTVITHGLDYPDNLEIALAMEQAVAAAGACPATLGIVDGTITVGLSSAQIENFATAKSGSIAKCSRRDMAPLLATGQHGSLTVAGTMLVAHMAGIDIMATGGIGGVHRGHPFDVSADLMELGRTPVAVVCAGIKSILDLPNTLEVLETQGVPVIGVGTTTLPAFYYADSGLPVSAVAQDLAAAGRMIGAWRNLPQHAGLLLTVPIPWAAGMDAEEAERCIQQAVDRANELGIAGSAVTPFVLAEVARLSGGKSVDANKALLLNNATSAATMALMAVASKQEK